MRKSTMKASPSGFLAADAQEYTNNGRKQL
jgi:hypothetical protein